jgi:hypothetical protein
MKMETQHSKSYGVQQNMGEGKSLQQPTPISEKQKDLK